MQLRSGSRLKSASTSQEVENNILNGLRTKLKLKNMDDSSLLSQRSILFITHFNVFLYALFFWIQNGIMPFLTKKLEVNPVTYGYLQTTFATVQLLGGPVFGRFGDIYGSRAALILAFTSAACTYGTLAVATNVPLLFLSRTFSIFLHVMQGGLMIVTDLSESHNRADALAKLGVSYGIGFTVGPTVGGLITSYFSERTAAFVSFVGSIFSICLVFLTLPKHTKQEGSTKVVSDEGGKNRDVFDVTQILSLLKKPGAPLLLFIKLFTGLPAGIFQSMFAVVALEKFGLTPSLNGYIMSYVGVIGLIMQGGGVGYLSRRFGESTMIKVGIFITMWAYLLLCFIENIWQLALVLFPLVCGMTIKTNMISSALTKTVASADTGTMLGVNMAVNSLIRSISPTIGGYLIMMFGWPSMGYFGFLNCAVMALYLWQRLKD